MGWIGFKKFVNVLEIMLKYYKSFKGVSSNIFLSKTIFYKNGCT